MAPRGRHSTGTLKVSPKIVQGLIHSMSSSLNAIHSFYEVVVMSGQPTHRKMPEPGAWRSPSDRTAGTNDKSVVIQTSAYFDVLPVYCTRVIHKRFGIRGMPCSWCLLDVSHVGYGFCLQQRISAFDDSRGSSRPLRHDLTIGLALTLRTHGQCRQVPPQSPLPFFTIDCQSYTPFVHSSGRYQCPVRLSILPIPGWTSTWKGS